MASAHVIEVGEITAGIVVLEQGGFRFFASERPFHPLEGALFRTLDQATRAARERLRPAAARSPREAPLERDHFRGGFAHHPRESGGGMRRGNQRAKRWVMRELDRLSNRVASPVLAPRS